MHKSQVLLVLALAYMLGIAGASWWVIGEKAILGVGIVALLILAVSIYQRTFGDTVHGKRRRILGVVVAFCFFAWVGGVVRYEYVNATRGVLAQFADRQAGRRSVPIIVQGYVDGE